MFKSFKSGNHTTLCVTLIFFKIKESDTLLVSDVVCSFTFYRAPVAKLVERRAVMREVVSSTLAGPSLRVLK